MNLSQTEINVIASLIHSECMRAFGDIKNSSSYMLNKKDLKLVVGLAKKFGCCSEHLIGKLQKFCDS